MNSPNPLEWLAALDGAEIPGGCAHCNAVQVPTLLEERMVSIQVRHDAWCPWWQARQQRRNHPK
jgi:hypothetical protein